jgi:GNAT superfamily N-acetyltransferase
MGLENKLRMTGGKLINMKIWGEMPTKPDYEVFLDPVYANPWIEDYVEHQIDYDVRANFLYETDPIEHCHCDVNTFNGELLKPVQYDYTVPDYMNSEDMDRQMTRTASLYVKRKAIKASKNNKSGPFRPSPGWVETPTPMATEAPGPSSQDKVPSSKRADAAVSVKSDLNKFSPKVPCHLRPARKEDMEDVRAIYNWEVANGIQALDVEPLSLADFEGILKKTEEAKMPFIVAVSGAYQSQWSSSQNHIASATQDGTGKILAFGFLTLRQPGLAGSFTGTGRASAKAHVFVHPEYRRKRLGHVCLDKILSTVSTRYSTKGGYEFVNLDDNPTYKYPWQHDRKFYLVSIEFMVPRKQEYGQGKFVPDETELKWFEGFLKRYKFWKVATLDAAHRSRQSYLPEPVWLDTVMFEHICQEGLGFTSNL